MRSSLTTLVSCWLPRMLPVPSNSSTRLRPGLSVHCASAAMHWVRMSSRVGRAGAGGRPLQPTSDALRLQPHVACRVGHAGQHAALGLFFGGQAGPLDGITHFAEEKAE